MREPPSVKKRGAGWRVDYRIGTKRFRRTFSDRSDAERAAAAIFLAQFEPPAPLAAPSPPRDAVLFKNVAQAHLDLVRPEHSASTADRDRHQVASVLNAEFGDRPIDEITTAHILAFRNRRSVEKANATVNRDLALLSAIFRTAVQVLGVAKDNPVRRVKRLHEAGKEARPLSRDEAKRLLEAAEPPFRELLTVALLTGMRPGELFHLRWIDCEFEKKFIEVASRKDFVTKTKRSRRIPMNAEVEAALRSAHVHQARVRLSKGAAWSTELVFPDESTGGPRHKMRYEWEAICKRAGLWPRRLYDLRHTFGVWAALAGEDLFSLQRWMGHASVVTTQRYARHRPQEFRGKLDDLRLSDVVPVWFRAHGGG